MDFQQGINDHNQYSKSSKNKIILIALYVDDLLMKRNYIHNMNNFKQKFYE